MIVDIEVPYYWYDHLLLRETGEAELVQKAIKEHDYDTFIEIYNKYPPIPYYNEEFGEYEEEFFPDTAHIWINNKIVGEVYILSREGFNLITYSEYECG